MHNPAKGNSKPRMFPASATNNSVGVANAKAGEASEFMRGSGTSRFTLLPENPPCPTKPDGFAGGDKLTSAGHDGSPKGSNSISRWLHVATTRGVLPTL